MNDITTDQVSAVDEMADYAATNTARSASPLDRMEPLQRKRHLEQRAALSRLAAEASRLRFHAALQALAAGGAL